MLATLDMLIGVMVRRSFGRPCCLAPLGVLLVNCADDAIRRRDYSPWQGRGFAD